MEILREIDGQPVEAESLSGLEVSNEVLQAVFQEAWARLNQGDG